MKKRHKHPEDKNFDNINPTALSGEIMDLIRKDKYTYNQICAAFKLTKKVIKGQLILEQRNKN